MTLLSKSRSLLPNRWSASIVLGTVSLALLVMTFVVRVHEPGVSSLVVLLIGAFAVVAWFHAICLLHVRQQQNHLLNTLRRTGDEMEEAESRMEANLELAQSASAEANALREAALALTQDQLMDDVLDTLLESLAGLVPCDCARVLLLEDKSHMFVAREKLFEPLPHRAPSYPETFDTTEFPLLQRVLSNQKSVLLADTKEEREWHAIEGRSVRSWLCVPLIASRQTMGVLSVDHASPNIFTREHLRLAKSLAVSAAAAIQNARLYEQAEIYGSELEKRVEDLRDAQNALRESEEDRQLSNDRFHKVFKSSPIPFSIMTIKEGRFLDVNTAFELRYGYSRDDLIDRTVHELGMWEDTKDVSLLISHLNSGGPIRNLITRLRSKSGELKLTVLSADRIEFEGQACVLAVSEDGLKYESRFSN